MNGVFRVTKEGPAAAETGWLGVRLGWFQFTGCCCNGAAFGGMVCFSWARCWAMLQKPFFIDSGSVLYWAQSREIHALSGNSDHFRLVSLNISVI
jgi:hypothetical protein